MFETYVPVVALLCHKLGYVLIAVGVAVSHFPKPPEWLKPFIPPPLDAASVSKWLKETGYALIAFGVLLSMVPYIINI